VKAPKGEARFPVAMQRRVSKADYGALLITPGNVGLAGWNVKSLPGIGLRNPAALTTVGTSKKLVS
jgi:hypothetical protein